MQLKNPEIRFEVTNMCNARCIMCPREKMKRPQGILDIGLYKRILDEAVELGVSNVCLENFGETFLDPHIFERAKYAKAKGLSVYTVTNGSLLDDQRCIEILKYFDKIRISMFGIRKDIFEKVHRGLSFETVKENVKRLFDMRKERKESRLKIEMYFLLLEENKQEVKDFLREYENIADAVSIWKPHNWGDGRRYRQTDGKKMSCGRPFSGPIQVQWDGLVVPCCFDYDSKIVLGDPRRQRLGDILHSPEYESLRSAHSRRDFSKFPLCDGCDQLNRKDDVLIYSTIKEARVGAIYNTGFNLGIEG